MRVIFRILGPFEVIADDRVQPIAGAKQRALLAMLVVNHGTPVTVDRLIDELWDGRAPPSKALHVYVSQLRRILGNGQPERRGAGYVLNVADDAIDARVFEKLVRRGSEHRAAGRYEASADALTKALVLWRGSALAEFADRSFAQTEIARLEELRLIALEERAEANLCRGRGCELVPELEALVVEHPYRERLIATLMVALFRCGRQADALEVFRSARTRLHDELGIEPGPEMRRLQRRILNQDPALGPTSADRRFLHVPAAVGPGRGLAALVASALVALTATLGIAVVERREGGEAARIGSVAPDSIAVIDPATDGIVDGVRIGSAPSAVVVAEGAVWAANAGDRTVSRIDPSSRRVVATVPVARIPGEIAGGGGAIWVANPMGDNGTVTRIDPETNSTRTATVRVGDGGDVFAPPTPTAIAVHNGAIWTNHLREQVAVFRPDGPPTPRVTDLGAARSADGVAAGAGAVWVTSSADDTLLRIDPERGRIAAEIPIAAAPGERVAGPYGVVVGYGSVWVSNALADTLTQVDPRSNAVSANIGVGRRPTDVAIGSGAVWVLNAGDGTVSRVDPETAEVEATIPVGTSATSIAAGEGFVWVTVAGGGSPPLASHPPSPPEPLPRTFCSKVLYRGTGSPDFLIVSELPTYLFGKPSPRTNRMRDAIEYVLARHDFRAGRYRLGYQSCDTSTSAAGRSDPERCAANARAYARNPSVLGIVGTYHSYCAAIELPILNAAPGGPVAMVSPSNTYVGLTHGGPGTTAIEPERYYPTGVRSYARVIAADDVQGAALGILAKQLGARRLYLLHNNQGSGYAIAKYVETAARQLGIRVVGISNWDPESRDYSELGRTVARARPDAVVLGGCVCENGPALIEELRSALSSRVELLGSDGFARPTADYSRIAGAADGLYITNHALPPERLPPSGRRFLSAISSSGHPVEIEPLSPYAAQATKVLIDAIARSNGTRASVVNKLFTARLPNGLVGSTVFDRHGNPTRAPISVLRLDFSAPRPGPEPAMPFAVFDRVIVPPARLLE